MDGHIRCMAGKRPEVLEVTSENGTTLGDRPVRAIDASEVDRFYRALHRLARDVLECVRRLAEAESRAGGH